MSNDLIKRMDAIENIWSIFNNTYNDASRFETEETELARKVLVDVQRMIESQPTAYDADKVVKRLETEGMYEDAPVYEGDRETDYYIRLRKAIEIVKSGGIEKAF